MSQQPIHPALLQPPFFVIPGISPSSPISTQIEQVDQQNTLLLQDIDANFARFHQIITAKILPEIKRFAIAGEPTREAAQFWKAFFESAMGVKLPVAGDITGLTPSSPEQTYTEDSAHPHSHHDSDHDYATTSDASFFANGVASSTPRPGGPIKGNDSWDDSMESPFDKMDRRLMDDLRIGDGSSEMPTPSLPSGYDLPGLHNVSTGTSEAPDLPRLENASRITTTTADSASTPRVKRNIFQPEPSSSSSSYWNGITDLRTTPLNVKFKARSKNTSSSVPAFAPKPPKPKLSIVNALAELQADIDDDDDNSPTMSPPVTMAFNLPPRAQAIYATGKATPVKQKIGGDMGDAGQARFIINDILQEMASESSPSMATPEALRRYSVLPPAFAEAGDTARQLFPTSQQASSSRIQPPPSRRSLANTSFGSDIIDGPLDLQDGGEGEGVEDDSFDDSFDSDGNQTIQPGGGMGQGDLLGDESYMSMSPTPGHALSPTTSEAGLIFGGKPGKSREADGEGFQLKKVDEMMTFFGGRLEDAELAESPLVAGRAGHGALAETPSETRRVLGRGNK